MSSMSVPTLNGLSSSRSHSRNSSPTRARRYRPAEKDETSILSDSSALHSGRVAVITGAASGIGLAAAKKLARHGLQVVLADIDQRALDSAVKAVGEFTKAENLLGVVTDVASLSSVENLKEEAFKKFGEINVLLHAAAVAKDANGGVGTAYGNIGAWKHVLDVNLGGTINVVQTFTEPMSSQENPSAIILTGSKQGITNPPGNAAYNASKAAVRFLTENLAHELRSQGKRTSVHLFIPGWTFTGMTGAGSSKPKPQGAWTPEETVRYMFDKVRHGEFYIICPDNETTVELDRLRIKWTAEDITEGRPALSRWDPEWRVVYDEYIADNS